MRVAARCRPFTEVEQGKGATRIVKMSGDKTTVQNPQQGGAGKVTKSRSFFVCNE